MAKILLGPTVIGIRGTVAGVTFSANAGGPYARGWHTPPNPRRAAQLAQRTKLGNWAVAWRSLTAVQKATWTVYAAAAAQTLTDSLGQPYFASGFNWYITTNTNLAIIAGAAAVTAPVAARPAAPVVTAFVWSASSTSQPRWTMAVGDPGLALNHAMFLTIVNSIGLLVAPVVDYYMTFGIPNAGRQLHCRTQALTKFGTAFVGQRAFGRIHVIGADGQRSAPTRNAVNATA